MTTQKQLKEWIPEALSAFQSIMPSISTPYPEIHIASASTLSKVRSALVKKTGSPNVNMKIPYTSMMETLHGDGGTAILIYQKICPDSQSEFNHALWHELGHFYAISTEEEPFFYFAGQGLDEDRIRQTGYWVWNEFVAESIANFVSSKIYPINAEEYKCQKHWRQPYLRLQSMIQTAYNMYPGSFSEYDLAIYYATLLTDPATVAFVDGAMKNELTVWNPDKWAYVLMEPDSIEPTAISLVPAQYGDLLLDISDLLQEKVEEDEFWKVDGDFLDRLGLLVTELNDMKAMARMRGIVEKK